ncbi:HAD-like protein, partial [Conidiobolus coronatus NRRL 28638]
VTKDTLFNTDPNSQILQQKFDQIFHDIYSNFARKENYILFDDVIPLLDELKLKGYDLGIISNMDERARDILKEFELTKYFKHILLSRECGVMKPNPQIFLKMNELSKIKPADCYHIGDDFEKDFKTCEKANWNGIWLNRECNSNYNKYLDKVPASKLVDKLNKFKL